MIVMRMTRAAMGPGPGLPSAALTLTLLLTLPAPAFSSDIRTIYRSDAQIRVEWDAYPDPRLQHYEVRPIPILASSRSIRASEFGGLPF